MKQGFLSLLNYEVPLVLANKEPSKKEYSCMVEYPLSALPIHYTTSGRNTKKLPDSVDAVEGILFYAANEVVIKPGEQRVVDTKITLKIPRHCLLHLLSIDRISPVEPWVLPGVLDPAYLRPITLLLGNLTNKDILVRKHKEVSRGFLLPVEEIEQIHFIGSMADLGLPADNLVCTLPNVHISDELTSDELEKVHTLLDEYSDIFSKFDNDYGHMKGWCHSINVGDAHPIRSKPYHKSKVEEQQMRTELMQLLDAGLLVPLQSPWSSPLLLIKK